MLYNVSVDSEVDFLSFEEAN